MAIVTSSGLLPAVNAVQAYFDSNSVVAKVSIGWRQKMRKDNQAATSANRVIFIPSDSGGVGGTLTSPRYPGARNIVDPNADDPTKVVGTVRELVGWQRKILISVWAYDNSAPEDEQVQIQAAESLLEWTTRAIHQAPGAFGELVWGDTTWTEPSERHFGQEILVGLVFNHPIFDAPRYFVYPTAVDVTRGDPLVEALPA